MVIKRNDVLGKTPAPKPRPALTPEQTKALQLLVAIDSGMTLTRFQIEASSKFQEAEEGLEEFEYFIQSALDSLSDIDPDSDDDAKAQCIGMALESLVIAIDLLDRDVEDVAAAVLR